MKLTIAAIVSTIAAMVLSLGFFSTTALSCMAIAQVFGRNTHYFEIRLNRGGLQLNFAQSSMALSSLNSFYGGEKFRTHFQSKLRQPQLAQSVWRFNSQPMSSPDTQAHTLSFPIWCALVPSLILPVLWMRRRRHRTMPGFAVITENQK